MTFPLISNDNLFLRINFILLSFMFSYSIFAQINDKELSIQYNSGEFDSVIANATKLLLIEPENPTLNLLLGRSLVEKGLLSDAEPYLLKVIENSESKTWMKAWGMNYFARIQFLLGDKLKSKQYLINCVKLNATNNVTKSSKGMLINLGLDDFYSDFKAVETEHFIFYFQSQTVVTKIEDFIEIREKAWKDARSYPDWVYYPLAGEFICRIIDKWGKEKLIELLKNQTYENAVSIYGDKLDAIISELESEIN